MSSSISIAPHLERALAAMSKDMAVEPQALVNQAVFAWLRINGYGLPVAKAASEAPVVEPVRAMPTPVPVPEVVVPVPVPVPVPELELPSVVVADSPLSPPPAPAVVLTPVPDLAPSLLRMAEIDADLEKLAKPWPAWSPAPVEEEKDEADDAPVDEDPAPEPEPESDPVAAPQDEPEEEAPVAEAPAPTPEPAPYGDDDAGESTIVLRSVPIALYLEREGEEPIKVTADRFIIGRGPHCDLVIDSPRVSREHVALTRKGVLFYLEDLNSSNGTWFGEERVSVKELESGDVINLGNEPVTFILRGE